jgi:hypothetical protein
MSIKQQVRRGRRDPEEALANLKPRDDNRDGYEKMVAWLSRRVEAKKRLEALRR